MPTKLNVVIILQHTKVSGQLVVHFKLTRLWLNDSSIKIFFKKFSMKNKFNSQQGMEVGISIETGKAREYKLQRRMTTAIKE